MKFSIIAAADENMGIGIKNGLPWRIKADMDYFAKTTTEAAAGRKNVVIMGRNTWLSLPEKYRPLPKRINLVLSFEPFDVPVGVMMAKSFDDAFSQLEKAADIGTVFVIGGASIYAQAIARPDCERVYLTEINGTFDCDVFFPKIDSAVFKKVSESKLVREKEIELRFSVYGRV
jgi:dihydrofolate reductase